MIRRNALRGMTYASASVIGSRGMTFLSQIVLGWLLSENDFATFAVVIGILNFSNALSHGGANLLLFQAGSRIEAVMPPALRLARFFDIGVPVVLAILAVPLSRLFDSTELVPLLLIVAASTPLRLLALPYRARAAASGQFGIVSATDVAQAVLQQTLIMGFAIAGFGVFSFVLGQPLVNTIDWLILRRRLGRPPKTAVEPDPLSGVARSAVYVLITAVGIAFATGGTEYLILREYASTLVLANYFFAFRLTAALGQVFGSGIRSVLIPSFSKLADEPERQRTAAVSALRTFLVLAIPVCGVFAMLAGPAIHLIWQGKWDASGVVALALILSTPGRLTLFMARSFLESTGGWSATAVLTWTDGIALAVVVFLVAGTDDLGTITWSVAGYRAVGGILLAITALILGGVRPGVAMGIIRTPVIGALALGVVFIAGLPLVSGTTSIATGLMMASAFIVAYVIMLVLVATDDIAEIRRLRPRRS